MDIEYDKAFFKKHGHLLVEAEKVRKQAQYWPWPLRLLFLFRADVLEKRFLAIQERLSSIL